MKGLSMANTDLPSVRKSEIIEQFTGRVAADNLSGEDASLVANTILDSMRQALVDGNRIEIRGFGTFTVNHYDAREGRHPKDPDRKIQVAAKRLPRFRPGKALRAAVMESAK
jgi:integration host factor subunit beta